MGKKKILIIEDEKMLLDLYASVFQRQGRDALYDVIKAQSYAEALTALDANRFDFVLSDYHLPSGDGISLISIIREKTPQTRSVLISGYLTPSIMQSALEAGAYSCLKKPCSISTLIDTVEQALASEQPPSPPACGAAETPTPPPAENRERRRSDPIRISLRDGDGPGEDFPPWRTGNLKKNGGKDFFSLVLDREARIVFADDQFTAVLNLQKTGLLNRPITDFLFSYFLQYLTKQETGFLDFISQNREKQVTLDFICGEDKIRRPLVCEFLHLPEGAPAGWHILVIGMDMEKRLELHRLIEFERESLRQLRAGQFDMVITVDKDMRVKTANTACLDKLKARQRDLVDRPFADLLARPRDRQIFEQAVLQAQTLKDVFHLRSDLAFKSRIIPVLINISAVRDSFNDELGYVLVIHDISRQLKMEATLRSVERMQALGQLAAGTAHQINNYTNTVMGSTELLHDCVQASFSEKKAACEEALSFIRIIHESVQKLTALTQHLTAFARAQQPPVISAGDVNPVIRDILTLIGTHIRKKSITLDTAFTDNLPPVFFSPLHLEQAVLNIIMNAIDAVDEKQGRIVVSTYADPDWVCIRVKDNGPGIPNEIRSEIFEAFVTTKPPGKGTGLGLNVARDVVESLKGTIEVESGPNTGTTMTIKIPIFSGGSVREQ